MKVSFSPEKPIARIGATTCGMCASFEVALPRSKSPSRTISVLPVMRRVFPIMSVSLRFCVLSNLPRRFWASNGKRGSGRRESGDLLVESRKSGSIFGEDSGMLGYSRPAFPEFIVTLRYSIVAILLSLWMCKS